MKYKLIKEYPNSPKLNSIVEEDSNGIFFKRIGELIYLYTKDQIKDYPEFWEEVKEYSFEILQFRNKITGTIFNRCIDIPTLSSVINRGSFSFSTVSKDKYQLLPLSFLP